MADYARRHYTALAKILSGCRIQALAVHEDMEARWSPEGVDASHLDLQAKLDAYTEIESQLVALFRADNARFVADRFRAAAAGGAE